MLFYQELYKEAENAGLVLYNYPMRALCDDPALMYLEQSLLDNRINAWERCRPVIVGQIAENYPECRPSDEAVELFFQMDYSAPAFFYNEEHDEVTLLFPYPEETGNYYLHVLSLEQVQHHLLCAQHDLVETRKRINTAAKGNETGVPVDLLADAVWITEKNCTLFAEATGYIFSTEKNDNRLQVMRDNMQDNTRPKIQPKIKEKLVQELDERMREEAVPYKALDKRNSFEEIARDVIKRIRNNSYLLN